MFLSVFDVFKIGVGPSSSHTMGPMVAGARFIDMLKKRRLPKPICGLRASLHGSLAFTGVGHATDRATILGLAGFLPDTYTHVAAEAALARINATHRIHPPGLPELKFSPKDDLKFDFGPNLPGHPNGLVVMATDKKDKVVVKETFYSVCLITCRLVMSGSLMLRVAVGRLTASRHRSTDRSGNLIFIFCISFLCISRRVPNVLPPFVRCHK
eukprot:Selendium_serpulae@DN5698_c0_g1_i1.p1